MSKLGNIHRKTEAVIAGSRMINIRSLFAVGPLPLHTYDGFAVAAATTVFSETSSAHFRQLKLPPMVYTGSRL
jgi:hypothetical protein